METYCKQHKPREESNAKRRWREESSEDCIHCKRLRFEQMQLRLADTVPPPISEPRLSFRDSLRRSLPARHPKSSIALLAAIVYFTYEITLNIKEILGWFAR